MKAADQLMARLSPNMRESMGPAAPVLHGGAEKSERAASSQEAVGGQPLRPGLISYRIRYRVRA